MEPYTFKDSFGDEHTIGDVAPFQRGNFRHSCIAELLRLAQRDQEHERFVAELIGLFGLDREALDREGKPVGDAILEAVEAELRGQVEINDHNLHDRLLG